MNPAPMARSTRDIADSESASALRWAARKSGEPVATGPGRGTALESDWTATSLPAATDSGSRRFPFAFASAFWLALASTVPAQGGPTYADVAPIFNQRCVLCHGGETPPAGLRLDSLDGVLRGSARGPVVKPGAPEDSELVRRIKGTSQPRMPMTGPPFLSDGQIAIVEGWVAGGLQRGGPAAAPVSGETGPPRPEPGEHVTYLHVAPIFASRCAKCHTDNGLMGPPPEDFRLTSYQSTIASFERARVVPGIPAASELLRRIRGQARPRMPLDGPPYLDAEEMGLIEDWIAQGARNAEGMPSPLPAGAKLRLHGTLEDGGGLDGLDLIIGPRTRVDKNPRPGDYVQVRGRLDRAGRVVVDRLRRR